MRTTSAVVCLFLLFSSCSGSKEKSQEIMLLEEALYRLYLNNTSEVDSILNVIDTTELNHSSNNKYRLIKGFNLYKTGEYQKAISLIEKATIFLHEKGSRKEKAETDLIWGFILEQENLKTEAASSYIKALDYFQQYKNSPEYFYILLGLIRTGLEKEDFVNEAKQYLEENPSNRRYMLFYNAKAIATKDKQEKQKLYLKAYQHYDGLDKSRKVKLLSNLALNSFLISDTLSAKNYIEEANEVIKNKHLPPGRLINYYLIKAYIYSNTNYKLQEAEQAVKIAIKHSKERPGLLSHAYLRKSVIERNKGKFKAAYWSLLNHSNIYNDLNNEEQNIKYVLLNIRYQLQKKNDEILRNNIKWLRIIVVMIFIMFISTILFLLYKRRIQLMMNNMQQKLTSMGKKNHEFKKHLDITTSRIEEMNSINKHFLSSQRTSTGSYQTGDNWSNFIINFELKYPFFKEKLTAKYPQLSNTDLKYCACLLLDKTNSQIAYLMDVTPDGVKKAKRRLVKKFNLKSVKELSYHLKLINQNYIEESNI